MNLKVKSFLIHVQNVKQQLLLESNAYRVFRH